LTLGYCEICGIPLTPDGARIIVDGVELSVCKNCSKRGKAVPRIQPQPQRQMQIRHKFSPRPSDSTLGITDNILLVDDYSHLIREARIQKNLTHEQVGTMIKEKANLLRRLEAGTLKPDRALAAKLERFFGVRLYVPEVE
jgi:putative transcription factor